MKILAIAFAVVIGVLSLSLAWTGYSQVETISLLREQNSLLQSHITAQRRLCYRMERLNVAYEKTMVDMISCLGLDPPGETGDPDG